MKKYQVWCRKKDWYNPLICADNSVFSFSLEKAKEICIEFIVKGWCEDIWIGDAYIKEWQPELKLFYE